MKCNFSKLQIEINYPDWPTHSEIEIGISSNIVGWANGMSARIYWLYAGEIEIAAAFPISHN